MQGSEIESDVHLLLCQSHKQDKTAAPYYVLFSGFKVTRIYMKTMATTSESADKPTAPQVLNC